MAGNRRTRRLRDDPPAAQRTLDAARPPAPEVSAVIDPSEVLEPPPPQQAGARLEERQRRWFRLREAARGTMEKSESSAAGPAEKSPSDPKA